MFSSTLLTASHQRRGKGASQSEIAYRILKEKIITHELPPASLLNETELMADLKLGRTPIREALQRLAFENLVIILPRRGTIVADLNMSDLQKLFELRMELELTSARLAAERATTEQVERMEALFTDIQTVIDNCNYHQLIRIDIEAHRLIAEAAHNEFLAAMLEQLYTHLLRLWHVSLHKVETFPQAVREHRQLIDAIKDKDGDQAAQIMRSHISGFQSEIVSKM